jgi:hypothetical protein
MTRRMTMTISKYEVNADMRNFITKVWPRVKELDDNTMISAVYDDFNDIMGFDLDVEECPFCDSFGARAGSEDQHYFIVCDECGARTRSFHGDGNRKEISEPFDQLVEEMNDKLWSFANNPQCFTNEEWQWQHKMYRAMCALIAIYLASEQWNRRA